MTITPQNAAEETTMDLSTHYLGLRLPHPLVVGASPMVDNLDTVRRLEDAGAAAIVMHSLFEEQLSIEHRATVYHMEIYADAYAEARSYFPEASDFALCPCDYLNQIRRIKQAVAIPLIASLNGVSCGGWIDYARQIEQAGADALELNVYYVATDPTENSAEVEDRVVDTARQVRQSVNVPVAVKLSQFYSSIPNLCSRLEEVGVDGLVVFNRFYQPDIDIDALQVVPKIQLSDASELPLRLRWLAILSSCLRVSLAVSGGVHGAVDAVKSIMCGADAVQMVSALLRHGPQHLATVLAQLRQWMTEHEYDSIRQMKGSMNLLHCPDRGAIERANYMHLLQTWREPA
jgi:dihydroorotate dehydrogenase (fumarate)